MTKLFASYEAKRAVSIGLALVAAMIAGYFIDPQQSFWAGVSALLVSQTTRGTPARQSFHMLFLIVVFVIAAMWASQSLTDQVELLLIGCGMFMFCGAYLAIYQPNNFRITLLWIVPPMVFLIAVLWPEVHEGGLVDRLVQVLVGGGIGMFASLLIFPVMPYREFSRGLLPIIDAMLAYSGALHTCLLNSSADKSVLTKRILNIETIMLSQQNQYPEWVFENGFNRNLRSGFRYVLLQLEYIAEGLIALDYHMRQPIDQDLLADVAPQLAQVVEKNSHLLQVLQDFFAKGQFEDKHENFTRDITEIQNVMHSVLPGSVDLLDISPDYVSLSAIARDVVDIRELLVKLIAGLPVGE